jgi:replicative DNA helicase
MSSEHEGPERLPPYNRDAERSVLGSILRDNTVLDDVVNVINTANFYTDAHQKIFEACKTLQARGVPIDLVTLADYLKEVKQIEDVGRYDYLAELCRERDVLRPHRP